MNLEQEIADIKMRNARVEADKAWEISITRRIFILAVTYVIAGIWLVLIDNAHPWLNALVPAVGFLLSTLSLKFIKRWWVARWHR